MFAIPGSIHNPLARGCHRLIRQGAALVESAEEIVEGLAPLAQRLGAHLRDRLDSGSPAPASGPSAWAEETKSARDPACARVLEALGHEALPIDRLAERTGLGIAALSSMLLVFELEGTVAVERGGAYIRRNPEPATGAVQTS